MTQYIPTCMCKCICYTIWKQTLCKTWTWASRNCFVSWYRRSPSGSGQATHKAYTSVDCVKDQIDFQK